MTYPIIFAINIKPILFHKPQLLITWSYNSSLLCFVKTSCHSYLRSCATCEKLQSWYFKNTFLIIPSGIDKHYLILRSIHYFASLFIIALSLVVQGIWVDRCLSDMLLVINVNIKTFTHKSLTWKCESYQSSCR